MKKIVIDRYGPPDEVARCVDVPDVGAPGAGEVVFDVLLFPINPADVSFCRGTYRLKPPLPATPGAECVDAFVSFEGPQSLDSILAKTSLPKNFDLFSLDIDGNEYHLWDSLRTYRPRVMLIEFNPTIPNDVAFIQPRDMTVFQGSSLRAFVELGERKGYELIAANETNAFFVVKELFPKFGITDNAIDVLHTDHRYETKLFQLYDGTLKLAGNTRLLWHNLPIDEDKLQVLPARKRKYPARVSESSLVRKLKYWARTLPFYSFVQKIRKTFSF